MKHPFHIAIIMDGNRRWGLKNLNNKLAGHEAGVKNIKKIINFSLKKKIKILTFFALSYDNFLNRKKKEIQNIFKLLDKYILKNNDFFISKKIKINFFGEKKNLNKLTKKILEDTESKFSFKNPEITINIAFNYSSKKEILFSIKKIFKEKLPINVKNLNKNLYTGKYQNPDILIRTGGQQRLSDFMLLQLAYTEFFFLKKLWPDFSTNDLDKIISKFILIKRNYGT